MNDKDQFEFEKLKLIKSVRQAVEQELKRRYSWIGLGLAVIMGSLGTLTVDRILKRTEISLAESHTIQKMATENLGAVILRSEQFAKQFELYQKEIAGLNEIARSIAGQLEQTTVSNLKYSSELRDDISSLNAVVQLLAPEHAPKIKEDITKIDVRLKESKVSMDEAKKVFQENANRVQKQIQQQSPIFKKWDR